MKDYFIQTENMAVGYGAPLISNIGLRLCRGEIMTLIGPNGAGKSTILKSFTRQLKLIGGTIYIGKDDMKRLSDGELAKHLSMMMTAQIHPELMTCRDVVAAGRYPYTGRLGMLGQEDTQKVEAALALVQAENLADKNFTEISDGQRQRIMLARAVCQEPEFMVLDEPTSFLDIRHKLEFLTIVRRLAREKNVAVLMALHELDLAQKVSDYVVCIKEDHIDKCGPPDEIFQSNYIESLYGMAQGSYNTDYGCLELPAVVGKPSVFIIGGNGSGIQSYRRLQREGVPFAAGILPENDLDYPVAKALAAQVISVPAYAPMTEESFGQALELMQGCEQVLCPLKEFGAYNEMNRRLYAHFLKSRM